MTTLATDEQTAAMGRAIRDAWGQFVPADDQAGLVTIGATITRLADLQADFGVTVDVRYDHDRFYRRAALKCPHGDWAGSMLVSDEMVHRRAWEPILGQLEKITSAVRNHAEECTS